MVTSWENLSISVGMSVSKVRTAMKKLESVGEVTRKTSNKWQAITLVKWDELQSESQANRKQVDNQIASKSQTVDNQIATTKEGKEIEEVKEPKKKENTGERSSRFVPPKLEEVIEYCKQRENSVDAQNFIDFYQSKNWMVGKNKMKDWKASVRTWEKNRKNENNPTTAQRNHTASTVFRNDQEDYSELNRRQAQNQS